MSKLSEPKRSDLNGRKTRHFITQKITGNPSGKFKINMQSKTGLLPQKSIIRHILPAADQQLKNFIK